MLDAGVDGATMAAAEELVTPAVVGTDVARRSATYASTATPSATIPSMDPSMEPASAKCLLRRTMVAASMVAGTGLTAGIGVLGAFATVVVVSDAARGTDPLGVIPDVSMRGVVVSRSPADDPVVSSAAIFPVARPIAV